MGEHLTKLEFPPARIEHLLQKRDPACCRNLEGAGRPELIHSSKQRESRRPVRQPASQGVAEFSHVGFCEFPILGTENSRDRLAKDPGDLLRFRDLRAISPTDLVLAPSPETCTPRPTVEVFLGCVLGLVFLSLLQTHLFNPTRFQNWNRPFAINRIGTLGFGGSVSEKKYFRGFPVQFGPDPVP